MNLKAVWLLDKLWVVLVSVGRRVLMMGLFKKALYHLMLNFLLINHWLFMLGDLMIIIKWVICLWLEILGKLFMVLITIILSCSQESWFQDKFNFRSNECLQFNKSFVHKLILYWFLSNKLFMYLGIIQTANLGSLPCKCQKFLIWHKCK